MIAPTGIYDAFPTAHARRGGASMITRRDDRQAEEDRDAARHVRRGALRAAPKSVDVILNTAFKLFPESAAARGEKKEGRGAAATEGVAFAHLMRGVHW